MWSHKLTVVKGCQAASGAYLRTRNNPLNKPSRRIKFYVAWASTAGTKRFCHSKRRQLLLPHGHVQLLAPSFIAFK